MTKIKYLSILILLSLISCKVFATAQVPDYLIYNNDTIPIFSNPLESYFNKHKRPDKIFEKYGYHNTGCWRGYIAYWELKNDSLFLLRIEGDSLDIELSLIFKDRKINGKVFADWVTQNINNPYGKLIYYEHMGYNSVYEYEKEFQIQKGKLTGIKIYDNSKSKKSIYTQEPDSLRNFIRNHIDYTKVPFPDSIIRIRVRIVHSNEEGKIDSVDVFRGNNTNYEKEAIRVVKSIPDWDVLYSHEKFFYLQWTIPVFFGELKKE